MINHRDCDFFRGIPEQWVKELDLLAQDGHYKPGVLVFAEGSDHDKFHVVTRGHIRLEMSVPHRGRIPILTVGPSDILAWSALLSHGTMTATATALSEVRTISFPGEKLRQLCDEKPELGYHLMKQLAEAVTRRLLATRLQLLDLFAGHEGQGDSSSTTLTSADPEC
jgi:CRP-like cAMP-binding protein